MDYLLRNLKEADLIRLDNGPLFTDTEQDRNGTIELVWTEDDGAECVERIMLHDLRTKAAISGNQVTVPNALGESIMLELFTLAPRPIKTNLDLHSLNTLVHDQITEQPDREQALTDTLHEAVLNQIGGHLTLFESHDDHPLHPARLDNLHLATREAAHLAYANLEAVAIDAIAGTFGQHPEDIRRQVIR